MRQMPWEKVKGNLFFLLKPDTEPTYVMRNGVPTAIIMGINYFKRLEIAEVTRLSLIELREYFSKWSQRSSKAAIVSVNKKEMMAIMGINFYRMKTRAFKVIDGGKNKTSG